MSEDFFGDLGKSISKYTQTAVDKANTVLESTKVTAQISTENKENEKVYQKIGEIVVKLAAEGQMELNDELQGLVNELKEHNAKITMYKSQLADIKGMKICPTCKELISKEVAFCPKCGAAVQVEEEPSAAESSEKPEEAVDAEFESVNEEQIAAEVAEEIQSEEAVEAEVTEEAVEETKEEPSEENFQKED